MKSLDGPMIRKVGVLRHRARKQADDMGLSENDLVLVETDLSTGFPVFTITKIEGSPIEFLKKHYLFKGVKKIKEDFIVITGHDRRTMDILHQTLERNGYTFVSLLERSPDYFTLRHKRGD